MYNSEHKQDRWLNKNVFKNKQHGVFVEFGAIDGIITSNSLFFEKELKWSGLCVEPIPEMFVLLKENRNCICENYAITSNTGETTFTVYPDVIGWSGITDSIEPQHKDRIMKHGGVIKRIIVKTIPICDLLKKHNLFHVDYMTIDTEGSEEEIIKSIDFDTFDITILDVENNYDNYDVTDYLKTKGYVKLIRLDINDIFYKSTVK